MAQDVTTKANNGSTTRRVTFPIYGFGCGGGGALTIERALQRVAGVQFIYVNPATEMAYVCVSGVFNPEKGDKQWWANLRLMQRLANRFLDTYSPCTWDQDSTLMVRRSWGYEICGSEVTRINSLVKLGYQLGVQDVNLSFM